MPFLARIAGLVHCLVHQSLFFHAILHRDSLPRAASVPLPTAPHITHCAWWFALLHRARAITHQPSGGAPLLCPPRLHTHARGPRICPPTAHHAPELLIGPAACLMLSPPLTQCMGCSSPPRLCAAALPQGFPALNAEYSSRHRPACSPPGMCVEYTPFSSSSRRRICVRSSPSALHTSAACPLQALPLHRGGDPFPLRNRFNPVLTHKKLSPSSMPKNLSFCHHAPQSQTGQGFSL